MDTRNFAIQQFVKEERLILEQTTTQQNILENFTKQMYKIQ